MIHYDYHKPDTIGEALELMAQYKNEAIFIAGGTDVMVLIGQKKLKPRALISLRNVADLKRRDGTVIGAGVTHRELQKDTLIQEHCAALHDAVCNLGSAQIRNVATIGGNICTAAPSADTACPLLVLDAKAVLASKAGEREVYVDDFFTGPGKTVLQEGRDPQRVQNAPFQSEHSIRLHQAHKTGSDGSSHHRCCRQDHARSQRRQVPGCALHHGTHSEDHGLSSKTKACAAWMHASPWVSLHPVPSGRRRRKPL